MEDSLLWQTILVLGIRRLRSTSATSMDSKLSLIKNELDGMQSLMKETFYLHREPLRAKNFDGRRPLTEDTL